MQNEDEDDLEDEFLEEDKESFEEDEFEEEENGLTTEITGGILGYGYLRHRDKKGRFASEFRDPERKKDIEADRVIKKFVRDYRKKVDLKRNVKVILLQLVDDFKEHKYFEKDKDGFETVYPVFPLKQFKRKPYHEILLGHPLKKSAFSTFVSKMVNEGLIEKIRHGKKLYLRITQKGLDNIWAFYEEYPGETWCMP